MDHVFRQAARGAQSGWSSRMISRVTLKMTCGFDPSLFATRTLSFCPSFRWMNAMSFPSREMDGSAASLRRRTRSPVLRLMRSMVDSLPTYVPFFTIAAFRWNAPAETQRQGTLKTPAKDGRSPAPAAEALPPH